MPAPQTMAQKVDKTIHAFVAGWNAHDAAAVAALYDADATFTVPGFVELHGRDAIKQPIVGELTGFPDFKAALPRVFVKDNIAVLEWVVTGTNTGDTPDGKATKRSIGVHGVDVMTFTDSGLIKEDHRYFDAATEMAQLNPKAKKGTFRPVAELPSGEPAMLAANGSDDEAESLQAVNAIYAAMDAHKVDDLIKAMSPDVEGDDYTEPGPRKGTKAVKEYAGAFFKAVPDLKQDRNVQIVAGDIVVTEGVLHGTLKGNLGPLKATKKPINLHFVDVVTVKDGKVAHVTSYANSMELMPPPPAPKKK